ncbi:transposase, partial [Cohnella soli]
MVVFHVISFEQFCEIYHSDAVCQQTLFHSRWPGGFVCPRCGCGRYYSIRSRHIPLFECADCNTQTSLTAGTILERTR